MSRSKYSGISVTAASKSELAEAIGAATERVKIRGKIKQLGHKKLFEICNYSFLVYSLMVDKVSTGIERTMTGYEAFERNKELEDKYYQSLNDEGETSKKLMRWSLTKKQWAEIHAQIKKEC